MSTYTTAAGYPREVTIERPSTEQILEAVASQFNTTRRGAIEWLAEVNWDHYLQDGIGDELPITDDMDDFSIHEPSIRTGESVSGLEKWIEENQCRDQWSDLVVPVIDLREFIEGKVLVDAEALDWVLRGCPMDVDALKYTAAIESVLEDLKQALPTTPDQANEQ